MHDSVSSEGIPDLVSIPSVCQYLPPEIEYLIEDPLPEFQAIVIMMKQVCLQIWSVQDQRVQQARLVKLLIQNWQSPGKNLSFHASVRPNML